MLQGPLWISDSLCLSVTSTNSSTLDPRVAVLYSLAAIKRAFSEGKNTVWIQQIVTVTFLVQFDRFCTDLGLEKI